MTELSTPTRDAFDSLTRSALDFLLASAKQLRTSPKYAVINLATAVELILKARLVLEHWSLIVSRPEKASMSAFRNGSFHSVGLDEAVERLRNIAGEMISRDEETCFRELRDHRNKLVHFYHERYLDAPDSNTLSAIAAEQCRAWFYLQRFLVQRWLPSFESYRKQINRVHKLISKNREYLQGKYLALKPDIDAAVKDGAVFETCGACGKLSSRISEGEKPIMESSCAVCDRRNDFIQVACPTCQEEIRIEELGEGECNKCGYKASLEWLIETFGPYEDPKEDPHTGYCSYCEYRERRSVVPLGSAFYCLSCAERHEAIGQCEWCSDFIAGDLENSYLSGCMMCDGRSGWDSD